MIIISYRLVLLGLVGCSAGLFGQDALHIDLDEAIALAVAKNYRVESSAFDVRIAEKDIVVRSGAFDPEFGAEFGKSSDDVLAVGKDELSDYYDRTTSVLFVQGRSQWGTHYRIEGASTQVDESSAGISNGSSVSLSVTQPLLRSFGFDSNLAATRGAKARYESARWAFRDTVMEIVEAVSLGYFDYYFAVKNVEIAKRNRDLAHQLLVDNRRRVELGRDAESDIILAESRYALRAERVYRAELQLRAQSNRMKQLIFDDVKSVLEMSLIVEPVDVGEIFEADEELDFESTLSRRPDYQQALLGIRAFEIEHSQRRNRLRPQLDLVGRYAREGSGTRYRSSIDSLERGRGGSSYLGVEFSLPIPNRTNRAEAAKAMLKIDQAGVDLRRLEQAILLDLDTGSYSVESNWMRIEMSTQAREMVERSLDAEERKLRAGRSNSFFVLDLQEDLANATIREIGAKIEYLKAKTSYLRQTGDILESRGVEIDGVIGP